VRLRRAIRSADSPALIAALARVALVPLFLLGDLLETPRSPPDLALAPYAIVLYGVFGLTTLALVLARREPPYARLAVLDTLLLLAVVYGEGGAPADLRFALSVPLLVAAFLAGPRLTLGLAALSLTGFLAVSLASPTYGHESPSRFVAVHTLDLAWRGALAVGLSVFVSRRAARVRELAESRRKIVIEALSAEARARRELAFVLHDELVQGLLSAAQDVEVARRGDAAYLDRVEDALTDAVGLLRAQILHLHPSQLECAGLGAALHAVAATQRLPDGAHPVVAVTAAATRAGVDDEVVFAVGRELLTNAARHADARNVALSVDVDGDTVVVCCTDDGRGIPRGRRRAALEQGHLGLAAATERVEALGGSLDVASAPGEGTRVRALVPIPYRADVPSAQEPRDPARPAASPADAGLRLRGPVGRLGLEAGSDAL
jgi:two-component system, NarL family, sensor kinase